MTKEEKYQKRIVETFINLKPFGDDPNKIPNIPQVGKWCPKEIYDEIVIPNLIRCGAIPKSKLKIGQWYIGVTRNTNYAMWNGKEFVYERCKYNVWFKDKVNHFEDDNGYALFIPIREIDKPENLHCKF